MGNTQISKEMREDMTELLTNIFTNDYSYLDIEERYGSTGYIDFIKPEELNDSIIKKGYDMFGRKFIVFKCHTHVNGNYIPFFTTFFQRYNDSITLYHTAGHYGKSLFHTEGGATLEQMRFLNTLLQNGELKLKYDDLLVFRVSYIELYDDNIDEDTKNSICDVIRMGWQ